MCPPLLWSKNEIILYVVDIQDYLRWFAAVCQQKRSSFEDHFGWKMGLEPTTFGTTIRRSNRLSYFRNYRFRTGGTTASAPRLRASKPAFRDCKYKPKNLFCKIFRRILSQNYSCAARKRKKKKRRCRCDRAGMPGANAPQRTATKIRLPEMAALSIYGSPSERIPISGP